MKSRISEARIIIKAITRCCDCDHFMEGGNVPDACDFTDYVVDKYLIPDNCPLERLNKDND